MNCRALFSQERVSAKSRQAARDILSAPRQATRRSSFSDADRVVRDHVLRPGDGIGRDRHAAGQRLELHDAERVGQARKDEHIRRGDDGRRQLAVSSRPRNFTSGKRRRSSASCGPVADHHLGAGQIEREEGFEILLDGDAPDADEDRPRQIESDWRDRG